jgi:phage baseplate assembly protein W
MTTPFDTPLVGYRFVQTQYGDTLQQVAARELGDASRWTQIVALNNLLPPYLTDNPDAATTQVVLNGSYLVIPAASPSSLNPDPNGVFGTDLMLTPDGLLATGRGDFATVSGVDNLAQALRNALATDQGELLFHGGYGSLIRRILGTVNGPTAGLLAAEYATQTVVADPRVKEVKGATATIAADVISVVVQAVPVTGSALPVTAKL